MISTIFFSKLYAGVKKLGRFINEKYFSSLQNALTFLLWRKIFRKKLLITSTRLDSKHTKNDNKTN